jgi:predicted DNA-binding transcriptional regulator AlpA
MVDPIGCADEKVRRRGDPLALYSVKPQAGHVVTDGLTPVHAGRTSELARGGLQSSHDPASPSGVEVIVHLQLSVLGEALGELLQTTLISRPVIYGVQVTNTFPRHQLLKIHSSTILSADHRAAFDSLYAADLSRRTRYMRATPNG